MLSINRLGFRNVLLVGIGVVVLSGIAGDQANKANREAEAIARQTTAARSSARVYPVPQDRKRMVFYVVDSDAQATAADQAEDDLRTELFLTGEEFLNRTYAVYEVESPEDETRVALTVANTISDLSEAA